MTATENPKGEAFRSQLETLLKDYEGKHPADLFRTVGDDFWFWINTEGRETSPALRDMLPGLPEPEVQRRWTGKTGTETLAEGFDIYRTVRDLHANRFGSLRDNGPVLDFGCGFGRVIRYFLKDLDPGQLLGTDYNESLIDYCVATDPWCKFTRNDAGPPLPFADNEVGYIYAYSVFSHFSESLHNRWLDEFKRVLRPGGALALTIRPRSFIVNCGRLRTGESKTVSPINKKMFLDTDAELARYDAGQFCFSPYDPADPDAWWGEACIPRKYVEKQWGKRFKVVDFIEAGDLKQHLVLLRA